MRPTQRIQSYLFLALLLVGNKGLVGQEQVSVVLERDSINLTVISLAKRGQDFMIPIIYPGDVSSLIVYDSEEDRDTFLHYEKFTFSMNTPIECEGQLFYYAKDRTQAKGLQLGKMSDAYDLEWRKEIPTQGAYNFPYTPLALDGYLYLPATVEYAGQDVRHHMITKADTLGNILWAKYYNEDLIYSVPVMQREAPDGNIIISSTVSSADSVGRYSQTMKLNRDGEIVWEYYNPDKVTSGGLSPWTAILSDSTIVQSYKMEQFFNPDFPKNNWNDRPFRLMWLNQEGQRLGDRFITFDRYENISISNLKASRDGEGFYAMGFWEDSEERRNLLIKFDNSGDTIWAHTYEHPDYPTGDFAYSIQDLTELEDGRIAIISTIRPYFDFNKAWLYTVNEHGCFEGEDCGDHQVLTSAGAVPGRREASIQIYPNPSRGSLVVEHPKGEVLGAMRLRDMQGQLLKEWTTGESRKQLHLEELPAGMYMLEIASPGGSRSVQKILIQE